MEAAVARSLINQCVSILPAERRQTTYRLWDCHVGPVEQRIGVGRISPRIDSCVGGNDAGIACSLVKAAGLDDSDGDGRISCKSGCYRYTSSSSTHHDVVENRIGSWDTERLGDVVVPEVQDRPSRDSLQQGR